MSENEAQETPKNNFIIQRIYVKDVSFETPNTPESFIQEWKPEISVNLSTDAKTLENNSYELILNVTVTAKQNDKVAYLAEVHQAGIFTIEGMSEKDLGPMLGIYCANILFPYAREVISDLIARGSFPQFVLSPVNFEAIYSQRTNANKAAAH